MVLAYFISKIAFDARISYEYCCINCIYNHEEAKQVPVFETYNMIARLGMIYVSIAEYSNLLLSSEYENLFARNLVKSPKIVAN